MKAKEKRAELYRTTGSTRKTQMYTYEQVEEIIHDHNLAVIGKPRQSGRSLITWDLRECPLERDRAEQRADGHKKGSEGHATISYDTQTSTPMFHCFEGKCLDLVTYEYDGNWWKALVASLGVVERLTGEEVIQYLERGEQFPTPTVSAPSKGTKSTKKVKGGMRRDERGVFIEDCRNGLPLPWESNSEEAQTARLAELDAQIEKHSIEGTAYTQEKQRKIHYLSSRHLSACWFCDVPVDLLQERLDRRFPITHEDREAEHARIETFYTYYMLQTTKEN